MEKEKLFNLIDQEKTTKHKIGMILSAHITHGSEEGALVSMKKADEIADMLIEYFKLNRNQKDIK